MNQQRLVQSDASSRNLDASVTLRASSVKGDVGSRRLHDTNRSAWWILVGLIPLIGWIVLIVFYLLPGTTGPNRFGPDPKSPHAGADTAEVFS